MSSGIIICLLTMATSQLDADYIVSVNDYAVSGVCYADIQVELEGTAGDNVFPLQQSNIDDLLAKAEVMNPNGSQMTAKKQSTCSMITSFLHLILHQFLNRKEISFLKI